MLKVKQRIGSSLTALILWIQFSYQIGKVLEVVSPKGDIQVSVILVVRVSKPLSGLVRQLPHVLPIVDNAFKILHIILFCKTKRTIIHKKNLKKKDLYA